MPTSDIHFVVPEYGEPPLGPPARTAQPAHGGPEAVLQPRTVIRGESHMVGTDKETGERCYIVPVDHKGHFRIIPIPEESAPQYGAITDWLNCTFPLPGGKADLGKVFRHLFSVLGPRFSPAVETGRGLHGWQDSLDLGESGAKLAYGGQNATAFLSLRGEACACVPDWVAFRNVLENTFGAHITRWDGAIDDYAGIHTVDEALALFLDNKFGCQGRRPKMKQIGNWVEPDGSGRTIQNGKRASGKLIRIYEKGMQLGEQFHPWVRWELELHSNDRIIPWDVLQHPDSYVVGAYPKALAWVQSEMSRIVTIQRSSQIAYEQMVGHLHHQYGKHLGVMLRKEGSAEKVLQKLLRDGIPKRLANPFGDPPEQWLE